MYEYSDSITDPFLASAQAMSHPYSNSKYSQLIQEIPKAIDTSNNDIIQNQDLNHEEIKLNEEDFNQINKENISYLQTSSPNFITWDSIPQFEYNKSMKNKIEATASSTKQKIDMHYCISKEYLKKTQELSKVKYPVSIFHNGKKVARSYIGYTIERPIGNESDILLSKFIIHGTSTKPIFTFYSMHPTQFFYSSENFFEAFQCFKDLAFSFLIFNDDVPALDNISPLKFVKIRPLKNEYYTLV